MSVEERPYICECSFCGNGLLRFLRCKCCQDVVALCDECELMWDDVVAVSEDANLSSGSSYPTCPYCGETKAEFQWLSLQDVRESGLEGYVGGESV